MVMNLTMLICLVLVEKIRYTLLLLKLLFIAAAAEQVQDLLLPIHTQHTAVQNRIHTLPIAETGGAGEGGGFLKAHCN